MSADHIPSMLVTSLDGHSTGGCPNGSLIVVPDGSGPLVDTGFMKQGAVQFHISMQAPMNSCKEPGQ